MVALFPRKYKKCEGRRKAMNALFPRKYKK